MDSKFHCHRFHWNSVIISLHLYITLLNFLVTGIPCIQVYLAYQYAFWKPVCIAVCMMQYYHLVYQIKELIEIKCKLYILLKLIFSPCVIKKKIMKNNREISTNLLAYFKFINVHLTLEAHFLTTKLIRILAD